MQTYKDLTVWKRSVELVAEIYRVTETFPKSELFGLTSQMRRAAVSIPANIAEGYARKHRAEYVQFARIAYGSGAELETYLALVEQLRLASAAETKKASGMLDETMRMLNKFIAALVSK